VGDAERRVRREHAARRRRLGLEHDDPRIVVYAGGIPLLVDGELVGAVGASGGTAAEDEECVVVAASGLGFD
jgi:uncharacterized protein GlcG (DUF336 family)